MSANNLIRLYKCPIIMLGLAVLLYLFLGFFIPSQLGDELLFSRLTDKAQSAAPVVSLAIIATAIMWAFYLSFLLWRSYNGKGESCDLCGGPVTPKIGRYGAYYKCLICGKGRKI